MNKTVLYNWDKLNEECGVFGVFARDDLDVTELTYYGLYALQHRGQESTGIAVADGKTIKHHKDRGLVPEVFDQDKLEALEGGNIAIGHVRYPTHGDTSIFNAQPLVIRYKKGYLALAHNGSLTNADRLRSELEEAGAVFQTSADSEVIVNLIARQIDLGLEAAITSTISRLRGAYALLLMTEDTLVAIRDPYGMRPLALGRIDNSYVVASESCAFDTVGADFIRDVKPGEVIIITQDGLKSIQTPAPLSSALCIFEFIYFARTDSVIDGVSVYTARKEAGKILASEHPVEADLVIGVPDSGTTAALGYAEGSGIPFGEGLIKNRYVGRTFISPSQSIREQGVRIKLNALKKVVKGKRIVMIDDSIVRGTTSKKIVEMLRLAGAREVHMRISSPPVRFPCYFGIDTPSKEQLLGASYSVDEICRIIGTDSLEYLSMEGLLKTVETSGCEFCLGCFNGQYPVEIE
ncbi:MAG: amidophosphoribosyltransferase [Clostridiales bacterium]|jgi:amidophosphoribosyltransferase|nr:amidophosphoribosyltransferase [Clostridiales bacterium]